jgi:hypothetical protein
MTITEVGLMGVKPGHAIMDENTPEGQILFSIYKNIISLPGGPSRIYLGLETEDPLMLWAFFDWETLGQHAEFAKAYVLHSSQVKGWDVIVMGAGLMAIGTVPKR